MEIGVVKILELFKFTCIYFNQKWNFAQRYLEFYSFCALGSARTLTGITRQCIAYLPKVALQIVAVGLLNALISF